MIRNWKSSALWITGRAVRVLLEMALPPICRGCGHRILIHDPGPLCYACRDSIPRITAAQHPCHWCGVPDPIARANGRCRACLPEKPIRRLASGALYTDLTVVALERFKYGLRAEFAPLLANWMIEPLQSLDPAGTGILVPIPLHPVRERERGFNQSEKLAVEIAKVTGHAVATNLLRRHRQTTTQTRLTKEERARNVHGAFVATDTSLPKAPLILVDDVATTGATLIAAAGALMPKGPTDLMALTACRARLVI